MVGYAEESRHTGTSVGRRILLNIQRTREGDLQVAAVTYDGELADRCGWNGKARAAPLALLDWATGEIELHILLAGTSKFDHVGRLLARQLRLTRQLATEVRHIAADQRQLRTA
ncbi:MAG: hypothetical protein QF921_00160, partial [Pseudomonadales bacterium]|nr:hypothetical protein [Pseudomonadales bacterium]